MADTHLQAMEVLRDPSHVRDYSIQEWQALRIFALPPVARGHHVKVPIRKWQGLGMGLGGANIGEPAIVAAIHELAPNRGGMGALLHEILAVAVGPPLK